jgi:TatD DNase family protein
MKLIDTHCHVHFPAYDADRREVILRARDHDIGMILVGTKFATSKSAVEMAEWYGEEVWATVGLHPTTASGADFVDENEDSSSVSPERPVIYKEDFDEAAFLKLAAHPRVVGIGETGLDYYHFPKEGNVDACKKVQAEVLRAHIRIADAVGKTLIIHCRDAHDDLVRILDEEIAAGRFVKRGILHCFTGTAEQAAAYVARGCMISFSGVITFPAKKTAPEVQESLWRAVKETPLANIIVETDAPYLAPNPHRGKRNEPDFVKFTAEKIAELRGVTYEKIAKATTENAKRIFSI